MAIKIPKLDKKEYLLNKKHPNAFKLKRDGCDYYGNQEHTQNQLNYHPTLQHGTLMILDSS